jgi:NAD(P)-dependent dehydrogenase (short-subunit alcohol dehydrogenase family)
MTDKNIRELFSLKDKNIVVTGAAGLLGKKHAEAIAGFGGIPILLDIRAKEVDDLANVIREKFGVPSRGYVVDITDEKQVKKNAAELLATFGQINGLVNNAANNPKVEEPGETDFSRLENFPMDVWSQDLAVGLTGAYLCSKWYGTALTRNTNGGAIVNIASDLGLIAPDQRLYRNTGRSEEQQPVKPVTYSVVKSGLIGLSRYLSTYWPQKNVRSNVICPGGIFNNQNDVFLAAVKERIPMGRMANVDELQGTLVFLLSDASSYMTGAILSVDGGRTAW